MRSAGSVLPARLLLRRRSSASATVWALAHSRGKSAQNTRAHVRASGRARWTSVTSMPSESASGASERLRESGAKRRASWTVQSTGGFGQSNPQRSKACRRTRESKRAEWAMRTRPWSSSFSSSSTSPGGGAASTIACVMPVKRWIPRDSGRSVRTTESNVSCSSPPPTRTAPTSVSSQRSPARPFVSVSTARNSAPATGWSSRSTNDRCNSPGRTDCNARGAKPSSALLSLAAWLAPPPSTPAPSAATRAPSGTAAAPAAASGTRSRRRRVWRRRRAGAAPAPRAERLGRGALGVPIVAETDLEAVLATLEAERPDACVIDSVQVLYDPALSGAPGSVGQVREVAGRVMRVAKERGIATLLVGHVTKEGSLAGPRVLEHLVDCVLSFEGERERTYRTLRALKNRFGSTNEAGGVEMRGQGLGGGGDASARFVSEATRAPGPVVLCAVGGARP